MDTSKSNDPGSQNDPKQESNSKPNEDSNKRPIDRIVQVGTSLPFAWTLLIGSFGIIMGKFESSPNILWVAAIGIFLTLAIFVHNIKLRFSKKFGKNYVLLGALLLCVCLIGWGFYVWIRYLEQPCFVALKT